MSFSANLTLSNGPDSAVGSVDDVLTLALSGNPTVVQWYVAVGQFAVQPADSQLTLLAGLPIASGSTVSRAAVQSAILAASPAPVGLWSNPLSVWVRADDDNVISNINDTTPSALGTFGAGTAGGVQLLKVERTAGGQTSDPSDDAFQVSLGAGDAIAYDHRIDVLLKPASGSGSVAPLTNAATFQVPMITGTQTPMASASYTGSQIYNAVMQKYASVYSNPGPNDPVVAGFRVTAMGGLPNAKFAVAQFDVFPSSGATAGSGYSFGMSELSNGGTVLARNDDKISFSVHSGNAALNAGNAPEFRVVPLQIFSTASVELAADGPGRTSFTLEPGSIINASIVRLSVRSGDNQTLAELSLPMPAGQAVTASSIAVAFSQSTAPKGPFTSVTASGDVLKVVTEQGVPSDADVLFTPFTYQRPYDFTNTDFADLLVDSVFGEEVVSGSFGMPGAAEIQKIALPATVVANAKYALKLGYNTVEFSPAVATRQGLLDAATAALSSSSNSVATLSLGTGNDSDKMLVTFAYPGTQDPVQFGKVAPLLPVYNAVTQRFELARPAIEASMQFMNVGSVDAFEVQAIPPAGSTTTAGSVLLVPLPALDVVLSAGVESDPRYVFKEADPDPVFTVKIAQPLASGEQLLFRVVPPSYSSVSMGAASAADFDLSPLNGVLQGLVNFSGAASTVGTFTLPIKTDTLTEQMEGFEVHIGHLEGDQFIADKKLSGFSIAHEGSNGGGGTVTPSNDVPLISLASPAWAGFDTADNLTDDILTLQVSGADIVNRSSYALDVISQVFARVPTGTPVVEQGDATHAEAVTLPLPASGLGGSTFVLKVGNMELLTELGPSSTPSDLAAAFDSQATSAGLPISVAVVAPAVGSSTYSLSVTWDSVGNQSVDVSLAQQVVQDGPRLYLRDGEPLDASVQTQGGEGVAEVQTFVLTGPVSLVANTAYGLAVPHGPMLVAITDTSPTVDEVVASWIAQVPLNAPVALSAANNTLTLSWTQPGAVDGVASVGALTPLTANAEASISRIELINAVKQSQVYGLAGLKILVSELADSDGANESTSIVAPLPPPLVSSIAGPTQASEGSSIALTINFANPIPVNSQIWWQAEPAPGMEAGFTKGDLVGNFATDWPRGLLTLAPTASDSSKALTGSMTLNLAADSLVEGNEGLMVQVGVMSGSAFIADGYAHPILISSGGEPPAGLLPAVLDRSFLKVPGTTAAPVQTDAVSNNGTPNDPTDDQIGRVSLDGVEKVTVAVGPISPGSGQLPANAEQLFAGIKNATSAEAFATAVSVAKQSLDVRFWVDKGAFNIDSDATLEPNVQALLNYVAPASGQGTVNFAAVGASPPADSAAPASTSVSFTNTTAGGSTKSAITLRFSEAVGINGAASPTATQVAAVKSAIVIELNPPQDGHSNQAGGTPIVVTGISGFGTSTLTLTTDTNLQAESLVRVKFPDFMGAQFESKLTDLSGNLLPKGEVWGGGSGDSTIVLDSYFSDAPITLRGNSGDDLLIGSNRSDIFVDGDGRDTISGGDGQDFIVLHESDLTTGTGNFARDVVEISLGQSVNGGGGTRIDHIQPSASNPTTSGFDVVSPVSANHDVLSLPSARIAADTLADIDGADNANSGAEITIGKHSIADGIITFKTGSGDPILIKSSQQVTDAMGYLGRNFTPSNGQPGTTVAFKYDRDANNTADSLFVYQQPGQAKAGLAVGETMPPTSVLIRDLIGIGSVKLGNQDGPYVLQLIDTQIPEPINIGLTQGAGTGMQIAIDFAEPVTALGSGGATLRLNGITPVSGTLASASGTSQLLISLPGTVTANDWVMLALDAVSVGSSAIVDSAGNVLQPGEGDAWGGIALGSSAANTINLGNASNFPSDREYDIDSGGGNDTIFGSAGNDNIRGGSGSDSITSASGNDMLSFVQGDSPAVTLGQSGNTVVSFTFGNGAPEIVTDFSTSDRIRLTIPFAEMKNIGELVPTASAGPGFMQGVMPSDGLVPDEQFFVVRGTLGSAGVFTLSATGPDSLVVYDAGVNGSSSVVSQSAFVMKGVTPEELNVYSGGIGRIGEVSPPLPQPVDAAPINTWLSFTETASGPVKSTLTFRVNEPVGINGQLTPAPTLVEAWRQSVRVDLNPPQDGPAPSSAETVSGVRVQVTAVNGFQPNGSSELVLTTDRNLSATDVVRTTFPRDSQQAQAALTDVGGNPFVGVEVWAGGTGANTIDLEGYFSDRAVWVRGNSGNDTLIGTRFADWLIDGAGADTLQGGTGADVLVLTEGGLNPSGASNGVFSRDVVRVGWGDSVASQSVALLRDVIAPGSPAGSGFDIVSGAGTQDILSLPSASIAASTTGFVSGVTNANADRALSVGSHRIDAGGMVVFRNAAGADVLPATSQQVSDALLYLSQSLAVAGTTVAFAYDRDQSGVADSLVLFQQGARVSAGIPVGEGYRLPGTVVLIRDLVGLEGATLGTNPGNKVVQIVDQLAPELAQISLQRDTAASVDIDFTEPIVVEGKAGVALKRNGLTALDFAASKQGDSSLRLSIASALLPTDWVLLEPDQAGPGNLFRDQAGNAITDSDGSGGGVALGGAGNDVIDISGAAFSPTLFFNIIAGAGDDSLIGSAGDTALNGGPGADSMTGGSGRDEFEFVQGDSPVVTVALQAGKPASFAFAGGADLITDLSAGERVALGVANQNLRGLEGLRPMGDGFLALRGAMPDNGLVADESFFVVRGTYALSGANAVFNVGSDNGPDTLIVYDGASGASTSQTGLVLQGVTPDGLNTFVGGVSALADQSGEYQGEEVQRGSDGPDTLEGAGSDDRVLLGAGGDDLARGLGEGDVFVGGSGTDTAQLPGAPSDYVVKLASPGLRDTVRMLSPDTYHAGQPLFAVQNKIASAGVVLIQAEWLKFGNDSANVDPMTLVGGGGILVVNSAVANAFSSVAAAIAAANAGSTIFVSSTHVEPAGVGPIIVNKDDLRVVLDNAGSSPLTFQLAEINSVRSLSLFGTGEASVIGNGFDNTLIGNEGSNWIDGRGGNDRLLGQGGDDDLYGGAGDDWLDGGDGFDRLMAGAGRDVLIAFDTQDDAAQAGATVGEVDGDVMLGGSGNDILIAMNSGSGFAPTRMMGGSGSDVFRISNPNGASGSVDQVNESIPQAVRAFIADLTPADGLDLSAIRTNAQGGGAITAIPTGAAVAGDYRVPLDGLFVAGLHSVLEATAGAGGSVPIDPILEGSFLTAALVGPGEMNAALARSIPAPSTQDLVEQVLPSVYGPLEAFIDQLYV